jgi:hypothetical protein
MPTAATATAFQTMSLHCQPGHAVGFVVDNLIDFIGIPGSDKASVPKD